jgi:hypothetical protein
MTQFELISSNIVVTFQVIVKFLFYFPLHICMREDLHFCVSIIVSR